MRFNECLHRGTLLRRYKRFFADVLLASGETVVAHCPNPGSMLSVNMPGSEVWVEPNAKPGRTLRFTWELIRIDGSLVGINTCRSNALAAEAIAGNGIPELAGYASMRREVRFGRNSRVDLLLERPGAPTCLVEVKNVTLRRGAEDATPVEFPDSVTTRGLKHLVELGEAVHLGFRAVVLFVVQRADAPHLSFAFDIDPAFSRSMSLAGERGVESICYRCAVGVDGISLASAIPVELRARAEL
jgi:sugar fermentation stimulation protein A